MPKKTDYNRCRKEDEKRRERRNERVAHIARARKMQQAALISGAHPLRARTVRGALIEAALKLVRRREWPPEHCT